VAPTPVLLGNVGVWPIRERSGKAIDRATATGPLHGSLLSSWKLVRPKGRLIQKVSTRRAKNKRISFFGTVRCDSRAQEPRRV